ncbi:MAG: zf-HC2 domain-containing protein [Acidobacteriota bacterium]
MKNCPEPEIWSAFIDGEIDGAELQYLKAHLERCVACRHVVANLASCARALGELPIPEGRREEILAAVVARAAKRTVQIPMSIAAAAMLLLALSLLVNLYLMTAGSRESRLPERKPVVSEEYRAEVRPPDPELERKLERFQLLQKPVILVRPAPSRPERGGDDDQRP